MQKRFVGDFTTLRQWQININKAAGERQMLTLSHRMADVSLGLVRQGFDQQRDPYGKRWKRRSKKQVVRGKMSAFEKMARAQAGGSAGWPTHPVLNKTGALKNSWGKSFVRAQGFTLESSKDYSGPHQRGVTARPIIRPKRAKALMFAVGPRVAFFKSVKRGITPVRAMVPHASKPIPRKWGRAYSTAFGRHLLAVLRAGT